MEVYDFCMIAIIVVLVIWVIYETYRYCKEKTFDDIREDIYQLFLKAEVNFASGEGAEKMDWVISKVHDMLPKWLQALIGEDTLRKTVQYIFDQVHDLLDDGKLNKSNKDETTEDDLDGADDSDDSDSSDSADSAEDSEDSNSESEENEENNNSEEGIG